MGKSKRTERRRRRTRILSVWSKDITGEIFNRLTVIRPTDEKYSDGSIKWECSCSCGSTTYTSGHNLKSGRKKSCGCLAKELSADRMKENPPSRTHGMSKTTTYKTWLTMRRRCLEKGFKDYPLYGGRGISIQDSWSDFMEFYKDMGERPKNMTIDREDNDGNYTKGNCKWATRLTQGNNTRRNHLLTYKGVTKTMAQWARDRNLSYTLLRARINMLGWSIEDALEKEVTKYGKDN